MRCAICTATTIGRVARGYMVLPATLQTRVFHLELSRSGAPRRLEDARQLGPDHAGRQLAATAAAATAPSGRRRRQRQHGSSDVTGTAVMTQQRLGFLDRHRRRPARASSATAAADAASSINRQSGVIVVRAMPSELRDVARLHRADRSHRHAPGRARSEDRRGRAERRLPGRHQLGRGAHATATSTYSIGQSSAAGRLRRESARAARRRRCTVAPGNPITGFVNRRARRRVHARRRLRRLQRVHRAARRCRAARACCRARASRRCTTRRPSSRRARTSSSSPG